MPKTKTRTGLPPISEAEFQGQIEEYAYLRGWKFYHTRYSFGSSKGFPDEILIRANKMIAAELKREGKEATPQQESWLEAFSKVEVVESCLWVPSSWPEIERVLE